MPCSLSLKHSYCLRWAHVMFCLCITTGDNSGQDYAVHIIRHGYDIITPTSVWQKTYSVQWQLNGKLLLQSRCTMWVADLLNLSNLPLFYHMEVLSAWKITFSARKITFSAQKVLQCFTVMTSPATTYMFTLYAPARGMLVARWIFKFRLHGPRSLRGAFSLRVGCPHLLHVLLQPLPRTTVRTGLSNMGQDEDATSLEEGSDRLETWHEVKVTVTRVMPLYLQKPSKK